MLRSIRVKAILVGVALVVGAIGLVATMLYLHAKRDLEELLSQEQFAAASRLAAGFDSELVAHRDTLEHIGRSIPAAALRDHGELQRVLAERPALATLFPGGISVVAANGDTIADLPADAGRRGINIAARSWFKDVKSAGRAIIGEPYVGGATRRPLFVIAAPLGGGPEFAGAIVATVYLDRPNFFSDAFRADAIGTDATRNLFVISEKSRVFVASRDSKRVMTALPAAGSNPMADRYQAGFEGSGIGVNSRGIEELSASKRMATVPWRVVVATATSVAFQPIARFGEQALIGALIASGAAALALWWLVRRLLHPVEVASRAIGRHLTGSPTGWVDLPAGGDDEVGILLQGFARLQQHLHEKMGELNAILDNSSVGITFVRNRRQIWANRKMGELFGYGPQELEDQGTRMLYLTEEAYRKVGAEGYSALADSGQYTVEQEMRHHDGHPVWMRISGRLIAAGQPEQGSIWVFEDIGERKRAEKAREHQLAGLAALNEIGAARFPTLEDELRGILSIGSKQFGLELGIVSRIEGDSYQVVSQVSPPETLQDGQTFRLGATYCALTLEHGRPLAIPHMATSPHRGHPCYEACRLEAYIGTPLRVAGAVFGTVNFSSANPYPREFDERDQEFMLLLGRWVGAAIERHQAQQMLTEGEAKLRGLYELSPLGIALTDANGRFVEFNDAFRDICGYPDEELKALDAWALTGRRPAADAAHRPQLERYGPCEAAFIRKDGQTVPVQLSGMPVTGRDGQTYLWSIVEDITGRKRAEAQLREQKDFLSAILDNEPECVKVLARDGTVLQMNRAGLAMLEAATVEEVNGDGLINYVLPEYRSAFKGLMHRVLGGNHGSLEFPVLGKNGTRRWLETRAAPLRDAAGGTNLLLGVSRDVTRRREAEQRVALSLRGADLAMTDWEIPGNRVVFGDGWTKLLGFRPDELPGDVAAFAQLVRPDDAPAARAALVRHLKNETPAMEAEVRMRHKDGHWVWVLARGMAVERAADGRAVRVAGTAMDITARKQAEAEVLRLAQWNELLLNSAGEGIYGVDENGLCTFVNPAALAALGFERHEVLGKSPHSLFHHHHADGTPYPAEDCPLNISLRDGIPRQGEDTFIRKNGEMFPVMMTATPMRENGRIVGAEVVFQDIAQRKDMERELVRLATTDSLTGAANRRRLLDQLEMELARLKRFDKPGCFLMIDIDHFKDINDTYGHAVGDTVLQHFADLSRQRLRRTDLFGRLGGEEFGVLLPGTPGTDGQQMADGFRRTVAATPARTAKGLIPFTISIGVAAFDPDDPAPDGLLARADVALYRAKAGGRNRVEVS